MLEIKEDTSSLEDLEDAIDLQERRPYGPWELAPASAPSHVVQNIHWHHQNAPFFVDGRP